MAPLRLFEGAADTAHDLVGLAFREVRIVADLGQFLSCGIVLVALPLRDAGLAAVLVGEKSIELRQGHVRCHDVVE